MALTDRLLQEPRYGWADKNGELIKPSVKTLFAEAFHNINFFRSRKNWITSISWVMALCMLPFLFFFIKNYISFTRVGIFLLYAMIIMSTHGTIWFHRYCTHKAYTFSHPVWRFITQNLVIKTFPEEIYVLSHHVHHAKSDKPGDPYNATGGLFYCLLSDVNHQSIAKTLNESDYSRARAFMSHTGVGVLSYAKYLKWGSVASPVYTIALWFGNWLFWGTVFYLLGGWGLVCTLFSAAMAWFILVRAFNYTGHGKGKIAHIDGVDFDRRNLSVNQWRPGTFSGEWHNNHHLYPGSARAGFLKGQLDLAWIYIFVLYKVGMVGSYKDNKKEFMRKYQKIN